jgi:hypothetical protein
MSNIPPNEGTWNIRLWRSREHPGQYSLEVQDPKSGVQSSTYGMRFPEAEWAYEWFRAFAVPDESVSALSPGSYISGKGESSTWFPILHALHHATGPREGRYPVSMWFYGSYQPMQPVDPLAEETPKPEPEPERRPEPESEPRLQEVFSLHHVSGVTNVFALQHFFHLDGNIKDAKWRINREWDEDFPVSEPLWLKAFVKAFYEIEGKPAPDLDDDSVDPFELLGQCEFEEIDPRLVNDVVKLFDYADEIPGFVAEYISLGPDETLLYSALSREEQSYFLEREDTLYRIYEGFNEPMYFKEYLAFLNDDRPIDMAKITNVLAWCAEWDHVY